MSELDDKEKLKRRSALDNVKARRELEDLGHVMSTLEGRRFMHCLLAKCGIMKLSYSGPGKSEDTAFYEGQRNIGNLIFKDIVRNFKSEWLLMNEEADKEELKNG